MGNKYRFLWALMAVAACGDDSGMALDASTMADGGGSTEGPTGTYRVVSPVWEENDCGAEESIEATYTFNSVGDGRVEVAEAPGLIIERAPSGDYTGTLRFTRDLRPDGIECSYDVGIYFELEPTSAGFDALQRVQVDETALAPDADCATYAEAEFGFSEWNSFGCHWNVRYRLER